MLYEINAIYREKHSVSCRKIVEKVPRVDTKGKIDNHIRKKQDPPRYSGPLGLRVLAAMIQ